MKKYIYATSILLFSFIFLLLSTFIFDDSKIKDNIIKSTIDYNFLDNQKYNLKIDNYTDMIILNVITYNNQNSIIKRAFGNEYGVLYIDKYGDKEVFWNQYENLKSSLNFENDASILYGRYWHGSQIIIKPLLYFFTYQQSLIFLSIIGIILIIISCILVLKKLDYKNLIIYILGLLSLNIYIFGSCYQYFFTITPMIIFNIIILLKYKSNNFNSNLYFYLFGGLSAYFMYVSFPLITLCYPLLILLSLEFKNGKYVDYKQNIATVIKNTISWFSGYALLYILKWVIGTIFVGSNFIEDALMSASQRLGITFSFNYLDVLNLNLSYFLKNKINIVLIIISLILLIINIIKSPKEKLKVISPILLIFSMPFIWMFIFNNHSAVHYWMISRIFSISIYSLLLICIFIFKPNKYESIEKLNLSDLILCLTSILFILLYKINLLFVLICIALLLIIKLDKKVKLFIILLMILSSILLINQTLNKNKFHNKKFFQDIYNELYHQVISYAEQYIQKNNVNTTTKIDIRDLIDDVNSDSVFLLSCKGYVIIDGDNISPYINCNDIMVTEGYEDN